MYWSPRRATAGTLASLTLSGLLLGGCGSSAAPTETHAESTQASTTPMSSTPTTPEPASTLLPGMPPPPSPRNVYAAAGAGMLSSKVRDHRELVYVPHTNSDDVYVIDQNTMEVIDRFPGGPEPQHVVPSYDLSTLYVAADRVPGGSLTPIDPRTGEPGEPIIVQDVYNLYFTPDGEYAIVVAEYYRRLDFYDPQTWTRRHSLAIPECAGMNHMDFTADGRLALVSCEFANRLVVVDVASRTHVHTMDLHQVQGGKPQDVKLTPDGSRFYVADMVAGGVYVVDGAATTVTGFVPTGTGAHGLYLDRQASRMFVTNRGAGSITVLDLASGKPATTWTIPGGGSPDMGGVSADGSVLWLSGRYHDVVYALSTTDGRLLATIPVGDGPHGLCVWPQPGRYSLGHTGILR